MNWHLIDWIWHVRGCLSIPAQQTSSEVFCKIDPLFQEFGTTHELKNESLVFSKKNQPSQDKMAVFDDGVLSIESKKEGSVLQYDLRSKTLLFCFLAPFFFLAMAELTIVVKHLQKPSTEVSQSLAEKEKEEEARYLIQSPIDKALGVPAPEQKTDKDDEKQGKKKLSPVAAYVFAGIFSVLYVIGRISEALSVKSLFRKYLSEY